MSSDASAKVASAALAPPPAPRVPEWLADLRSRLLRVAVQAVDFDRIAAGLEPDQRVLELAASQPEHAKTPGEYLSGLVTETRIAAGRDRLAALADTLKAIEATYGVDRHVLVAIWGIESNYGTAMGERSVIRSLMTLAALDQRRQAFWQSELAATLRIIGRGSIAPGQMTGSWAGAGGHTQFMPSTYLAHAVDFDGDGKADIWNPASAVDALASTANYLRASGWQSGQPWGFEVSLPRGLNLALSAPGQAQPLASWRARGLMRAGGGEWPSTRLPLQLLLPAGAGGPAFLVTDNFRAILKYNPAVAYALAVAHLSDRLAGGMPFVASWPDDKPLARVEREELQRRLAERGLDTGGIDGIIGGRSQDAIRAFQRSRALPEDGHASPQLLELLRSEPET